MDEHHFNSVEQEAAYWKELARLYLQEFVFPLNRIFALKIDQ